jgi:hypothetical protein
MSGFIFYRVLYNSVVLPVICQGLYLIGFFIIVLFALLYVRDRANNAIIKNPIKYKP